MSFGKPGHRVSNDAEMFVALSRVEILRNAENLRREEGREATSTACADRQETGEGWRPARIHPFIGISARYCPDICRHRETAARRAKRTLTARPRLKPSVTNSKCDIRPCVSVCRAGGLWRAKAAPQSENERETAEDRIKNGAVFGGRAQKIKEGI